MTQVSIVYVATGLKYVQESILSATRSRFFSGACPIYCFTDQERTAIASQAFDYVVPHPNPTFSYRDKILPLFSLPSDICLYLDTDAALTASLEYLVQTVGDNHCLASYAPVRHPVGWSDSSVPLMFPELNTGVLLLRRCTKQQRFINKWCSLYDRISHDYGQAWDQATFRSVLWNFICTKSLRFQVLPPEANFRITKPWVAGKGLPVNVVHGRVPNGEWDNLIHYLNDDINIFRTWTEWFRLYPSSSLTLKIPPQPLG